MRVETQNESKHKKFRLVLFHNNSAYDFPCRIEKKNQPTSKGVRIPLWSDVLVGRNVCWNIFFSECKNFFDIFFSKIFRTSRQIRNYVNKFTDSTFQNDKNRLKMRGGRFPLAHSLKHA